MRALKCLYDYLQSNEADFRTGISLVDCFVKCGVEKKELAYCTALENEKIR